MAKQPARGRTYKPATKVKHSADPGYDHAPKRSINALKAKIRSTERLLQRGNDLPADIRVEKERALASYKRDAEDLARVKGRSKIISKYHKVRFFERQRATRILRRLTKQLGSVQREDARYESLTTAVADAQIDLKYTMYFPLTEKYQSLYIERKNEDLDSPSLAKHDTGQRAERPPMWKIVKQCTEEDTLESLREGKLRPLYCRDDGQQQPALGPTRSTKETYKSHNESKKSRSGQQTKAAEDNDSDDGFFVE